MQMVQVLMLHYSCLVQFSSVAQLCPILCDPMNRSTTGLPVHHQFLESTQCPSSRWCHPIISFSVVPFSCPQSFPASGCFQMSQLFTSGAQSIGVAASISVLPMKGGYTFFCLRQILSFGFTFPDLQPLLEYSFIIYLLSFISLLFFNTKSLLLVSITVY